MANNNNINYIEDELLDVYDQLVWGNNREPTGVVREAVLVEVMEEGEGEDVDKEVVILEEDDNDVEIIEEGGVDRNNNYMTIEMMANPEEEFRLPILEQNPRLQQGVGVHVKDLAAMKASKVQREQQEQRQRHQPAHGQGAAEKDLRGILRYIETESDKENEEEVGNFQQTNQTNKEVAVNDQLPSTDFVPSGWNVINGTNQSPKSPNNSLPNLSGDLCLSHSSPIDEIFEFPNELIDDILHPKHSSTPTEPNVSQPQISACLIPTIAEVHQADSATPNTLPQEKTQEQEGEAIANLLQLDPISLAMDTADLPTVQVTVIPQPIDSYPSLPPDAIRIPSTDEVEMKLLLLNDLTEVPVGTSGSSTVVGATQTPDEQQQDNLRIWNPDRVVNLSTKNLITRPEKRELRCVKCHLLKMHETKPRFRKGDHCTCRCELNDRRTICCMNGYKNLLHLFPRDVMTASIPLTFYKRILIPKSVRGGFGIITKSSHRRHRAFRKEVIAIRDRALRLYNSNPPVENVIILHDSDSESDNEFDPKKYEFY